MHLLVLFCVIAGAFAANECGPNSHHNDCGTMCPVTCDNYRNPPKVCVLMCNSGCECDEGYVQDKDGNCIVAEDCPAHETNSCLEKPDGGMCRGYFPMFYYDAKTGTCEEFIYGGCQGNGNRFGSKEDCLAKCSDVRVWEASSDDCQLPLETGPCMALFHRYGFNKKTGKCEKFVYGGCGGNGNNFNSIEECESKCSSQRALDRPDCDKGAETGSCFGSFTRYFYDQEAGMCKTFIYGGCGGNRNNFQTRDECYNKCGAL